MLDAPSKALDSTRREQDEGDGEEKTTTNSLNVKLNIPGCGCTLLYGTTVLIMVMLWADGDSALLCSSRRHSPLFLFLLNEWNGIHWGVFVRSRYFFVVLWKVLDRTNRTGSLPFCLCILSMEMRCVWLHSTMMMIMVAGCWADDDEWHLCIDFNSDLVYEVFVFATFRFVWVAMGWMEWKRMRWVGWLVASLWIKSLFVIKFNGDFIGFVVIFHSCFWNKWVEDLDWKKGLFFFKGWEWLLGITEDRMLECSYFIVLQHWISFF